MKLKIIIQTLLLQATIICHGQPNEKDKHPNFYAGIGPGLDDDSIVCKEGVSVKNESSYV